MTVPAETTPAAGVSRWWRTATVALSLGVAGWIAYRRSHGPPLPPAPPLSTPDPRLDRVLDAVDLDRVPLASALVGLGRRTGVATDVRWDQLAAGHVTAETPVTVHLRRVTTADALDAVLRAAAAAAIPPAANPYDEPTWDETAGVVLVGTASAQVALFGDPVTRVYDVRDLIAAAMAAGGSIRVDRPPTTAVSDASANAWNVASEIEKYLIDTVRPWSWQVNGGTATADFWAGFLYVRQSERGQRDVAAALRSMRVAR